MTGNHSLLGLLHRATHRIPGVPAHLERPAGHQGTTRHGRAWRHPDVSGRAQHRTWNRSPARPPRILVAWQSRVAAFFSQEL
jgi:hypothetical protein